MIAAIQARGWNMAEAARRTGVSYDVIRELHRRKDSTTSEENARKLRRALGLDSDEANTLTRVENHEPGPPGNHLVAVFDVHASAGYGAMVDAEEVAYSLAFPPTYLRKLTSSAPGNLAIISVKGDSMEPTLLDDDIVLLDKSKTNLSYDGLFVLRFGDALHVKRVGRSPRAGCVTILSDNRIYVPIETPLADVHAVGKVLWYGRKV